MNKKHLIYIVAATFTLMGNLVYAASASVQINTIIPDYMPDQIRFKTDSAIGGCAGGTWLDRFGRGSDQDTKRENNKIAYSSLLAALISGKKVVVYVNETNCQVDNLQFTNQ